MMPDICGEHRGELLGYNIAFPSDDGKAIVQMKESV